MKFFALLCTVAVLLSGCSIFQNNTPEENAALLKGTTRLATTIALKEMVKEDEARVTVAQVIVRTCDDILEIVNNLDDATVRTVETGLLFLRGNVDNVYLTAELDAAIKGITDIVSLKIRGLGLGEYDILTPEVKLYVNAGVTGIREGAALFLTSN